MNMLSHLDSGALVEAAARWAAFFLPVALKTTAMAGLLWLAARRMRHRSASSRHLLWSCGLAGLLLLPLLEVSLPSWPIVPWPEIRLARPEPSSAETASVETGSTETASAGGPATQGFFSGHAVAGPGLSSGVAGTGGLTVAASEARNTAERRACGDSRLSPGP